MSSALCLLNAVGETNRVSASAGGLAFYYDDEESVSASEYFGEIHRVSVPTAVEPKHAPAVTNEDSSTTAPVKPDFRRPIFVSFRSDQGAAVTSRWDSFLCSGGKPDTWPTYPREDLLEALGRGAVWWPAESARRVQLVTRNPERQTRLVYSDTFDNTTMYYSDRFFMIRNLLEQLPESSIVGRWDELRVSSCEAVVILFLPRLVSAPPQGRKKIRGLLLRFAEPLCLWKYAIEEYDRSGKEDILLHTVSLLEDFGETAWPALKEIAKSKRDVCELFSGAIAQCPGVSNSEKTSALRALALNPSGSVRRGLFEQLSQLPRDVAKPVLELLSIDVEPEIGEEAREASGRWINSIDHRELSMHFIRVHGQQTHFAAWTEKEPELSKLLLFFDIQASLPKEFVVSVFEVQSELEELESVAAVFQTTRPSSDKRFGVLVADEDCRKAGIVIDRSQRGKTGIHRVDSLHADLRGTPEQFSQLMVEILQRVWQGERRLRIFPAKRITGQVAVFFKLPQDEIDPATRTDCECVLSKANCHQFNEGNSTVEILGKLKGSTAQEIRALRTYSTPKPRAPKKSIFADLKEWCIRRVFSRFLRDRCDHDKTRNPSN